MAVQNQGVPNPGYPLVDNTGKVNPIWFQFMVSLWQRTGGGTNSGNVQSVSVTSSDGIVSSVTNPNTNPAIVLALDVAEIINQLGLFTATTAGTVPASGGGTANYLRADGTWSSTGTVTNVSVSTNDGVSGSVLNPSTTPAITLTLGNITPTAVTPVGLVNISAAAAGQIQFPATQHASANANTLDDYAESAWTPSLGGTTTYTTQTGTYTKIGRFVYLQGFLSINSIGTGNTGIISGIPAAVSSALTQPGSVGFFFNSATAVTSLSCYVTGTNIHITGLTAAAVTTTDPITFFQNSSQIYFSVCYST